MRGDQQATVRRPGEVVGRRHLDGERGLAPVACDPAQLPTAVQVHEDVASVARHGDAVRHGAGAPLELAEALRLAPLEHIARVETEHAPQTVVEASESPGAREHVRGDEAPVGECGHVVQQVRVAGDGAAAPLELEATGSARDLEQLDRLAAAVIHDQQLERAVGPGGEVDAVRTELRPRGSGWGSPSADI